MRPPFKPPAPPKPMHDPGMVAAYLHSKNQQEMARRDKSGASAAINFPAHEGSYAYHGRGGWLKRIFLVLLLLSLVVGALLIVGNIR